MIKAVIFDMDGLMIDSEPFHIDAYDKALLDFKYRLSEAEKIKYVGISDHDICVDLVSRLKLPCSPQELVAKKTTEYKKILNNKLIAQPGLHNLLSTIYGKYKLAVASSSHKDEIEIVLNRLKVKKMFDAIVSATQVKNGKPQPDIFLYAASRIDVTPASCLVLEDAISGVRAAKAAGMICYAIPSKETAHLNFNIADRRLDSLVDVYKFIQQDS